MPQPLEPLLKLHENTELDYARDSAFIHLAHLIAPEFFFKIVGLQPAFGKNKFLLFGINRNNLEGKILINKFFELFENF